MDLGSPQSSHLKSCSRRRSWRVMRRELREWPHMAGQSDPPDTTTNTYRAHWLTINHAFCVPSSSFVECSLMEQKTDWLKGTSGEIIRRLKDREGSALDYKLWLIRWTQCMIMCDLCVLLHHSACVYILFLVLVGCSLLEEKVDQMKAELTKRHIEREESAQQIKRCMLVSWTIGINWSHCMHVSSLCWMKGDESKGWPDGSRPHQKTSGEGAVSSAD